MSRCATNVGEQQADEHWDTDCARGLHSNEVRGIETEDDASYHVGDQNGDSSLVASVGSLVSALNTFQAARLVK